ncbi:MAG: MFS transporter [Gammaproteobacteria bacterium]|nr:MFS transporter [Gammaproteobacteria bacterium]
MSVPAASEPFASSTKVVALVSTAHFFSHFYLLLLPPLFPILVNVYGVGFTELGIALAVFSLTTGLTQAPVGFLVDRYGARGLLIGGIVLEGVAFALVGVLPFYPALIGLMVAAGLANAVYHPADYSILNASVPERRMGRAFSVHTTSGFLGDALAPVTIVALLTVMAWDDALMVCGAAGVLMAMLLWLNSGVLADVSNAGKQSHATNPAQPPAKPRQGIALLFSLPVLTGLLFYVGISTYGRGVANFGPSVLHLGYDAPLAVASTIVACYLFASPVGVLAGGWVADHIRRHDVFSAACFVVVGTMICIVAAADLPLVAVGVLFAIAGFASGLVAPSRDMLIRALTPPGQIGKVFGFVSTGFNIGGIIAPPLFGALLDHAEPYSVFWIAGLVAFATTATVMMTGRQARRSQTQIR